MPPFMPQWFAHGLRGSERPLSHSLSDLLTLGLGRSEDQRVSMGLRGVRQTFVQVAEHNRIEPNPEPSHICCVRSQKLLCGNGAEKLRGTASDRAAVHAI